MYNSHQLQQHKIFFILFLAFSIFSVEAYSKKNIIVCTVFTTSIAVGNIIFANKMPDLYFPLIIGLSTSLLVNMNYNLMRNFYVPTSLGVNHVPDIPFFDVKITAKDFMERNNKEI